MRAREKQVLLIVGIVLFAALGAFVWTQLDAARAGERLTYEAAGAPEEENEGGNGPLVAKNGDGPGGAVVSDGGASSGDGEGSGSSGAEPDENGGSEADGSPSNGGAGGAGGDANVGGNGDPNNGAGGSGSDSAGQGDNKQDEKDGGNEPDPFEGDPGGDPANSGRPAEGVPAVPYDPAHEAANSEGQTAADNGEGDFEAHTAAVDLPALFSPVEADDTAGVPADGLLAFLRETDPAVLRDESAGGLATLAYADGNVFELKTLADGKTLVTMTYRFPTGQTSRRGDMTYNEKTERPRAFAAFEYLLPEYAETVENDFTSMRHWEEVYCRAYGLAEPDWSAFVRSRYYGARYCRMSVTRDTVTVTVYPAGYVDESGDFAANGSYREFFTYPIR